MNEGTSESPPIIARLVTIGRFGLILAGLLALLATLISADGGTSTVLTLFRVVGSIGVMACAVIGLVKPIRAVDLGAVAFAALLAGSAVGNAFNSYDMSVSWLLAWLLLLGFGGLTAVGLAYGPPVVDGALISGIKGIFSSGSSAAPAYAPPAQQYAPPSQQYAPPAQQYAPPEQTVEPAVAESPVATEVEAEAEPAAAEESAETAEAGWYPQGDGINARYWDGTAWTDDIRPITELDN